MLLKSTVVRHDKFSTIFNVTNELHVYIIYLTMVCDIPIPALKYMNIHRQKPLKMSNTLGFHKIEIGHLITFRVQL